MRMGIVAAAVVALSSVSFARSHQTYSDYGTGSNPKNEQVSGYTKRDGTYVEPYHRTVENDTRNDNYSTRGNENPYTGKTGYGKTDADTNYGNPKKYGY